MVDDLSVDVDRAQEGGFRHELVVAEHHVFGVVERREAQCWNPQLQVHASDAYMYMYSSLESTVCTVNVHYQASYLSHKCQIRTKRRGSMLNFNFPASEE